jgi:AcrB/AcrD/AcrF family
MMIDFAIEAQRKEGKCPEEAIYQGCLVRFRPIMMTTMAALMGTLPIALGFGSGAESRRPLGLAVVGGLVFSQILMLYITPIFYTYMESARFSRTNLPPAASGRRGTRHRARTGAGAVGKGRGQLGRLCAGIPEVPVPLGHLTSFSRRRPQLEKLVMSFAD